MPKISEQQKQKNQDHIILKARELFIQEGYQTVTVDSICKASGISKGSFYTYFPSKEALFLELAKDTDRLKKEFEETASVKADNPNFDLIDLWDLIFSDVTADDITNYRLKLEFWMESYTNETLRKVMLQKSKTSLNIFKELVQKKYSIAFDEAKLNSLAIFFWAQADGLMLYFAAQQRVPSAREIDEFRNIIKNFVEYLETNDR